MGCSCAGRRCMEGQCASNASTWSQRGAAWGDDAGCAIGYLGVDQTSSMSQAVRARSKGVVCFGEAQQT